MYIYILRFWITRAPRRVSNHLSGILSVSRGQFLSTLVALSLELELVSPWALRLCSAVFRTSITSVLVSQHRNKSWVPSQGLPLSLGV